MRRAILVPLVLCFALCLSVRPAPAVPSVDGEDLAREVIIDGPSDLVWRLLTTKRGMESWLAPHADVDLRVGGRLRTHQDASGKLGDPRTLVNTITALKPGRRISLRVDQTPEGFPLANFVVGTWYDILVDPLDRHRTRVRCVGHGFGSGPTVYAVRPFFDRGTNAAFEELEKAVAAQTPSRAR